MNSVFQLNHHDADRLIQKFGSPLLVVSTRQAEENYRFLSARLPRVRLHYAMKSNPAEPLLQAFRDLGSFFDVATIGEIRKLVELGVSGDRMIYANTMKPVASMIEAHKLGVTRFTYDSICEVEKMAQAVPGATVLLRVRISNAGALVNLNKKFGASPDMALQLLQAAKNAGLDVAGLSFHVGSQTREAAPYLNSLDICRTIFDEAAQAGIHLRCLDIGGGFPIDEWNRPIDSQNILDTVSARLDELFPHTELLAEPGRTLCGTTTSLITTVIGTGSRDGNVWYFLDDGIYGSFSGILFDHWDFELQSSRQEKIIEATFAGPSCDSLDVLFEKRATATLEVGDLLIVPHCGAYCSASATTFNGFPLTRTVVWEEQ